MSDTMTLRTNVGTIGIVLTNERNDPPTKWTLRYRNSLNPVTRVCDRGHSHALVLYSLKRAIGVAAEVAYNPGAFDNSICIDFEDTLPQWVDVTENGD